MEISRLFTSAVYDVKNTRGKTGFVDQSSECQCCERGDLGRFEDDGVSGCERGRNLSNIFRVENVKRNKEANLPGQHQQREVPRNDLTYSI